MICPYCGAQDDAKEMLRDLSKAKGFERFPLVEKHIRNAAGLLRALSSEIARIREDEKTRRTSK
jgi:hypothetical protein